VISLSEKYPLISILYNYFRGRKGGTRRRNLSAGLSPREELQTYSAIWDFGARPYALGDILSWFIEVNIRFITSKRQLLDIIILADPSRPGSNNQPYVVKQNYERYLHSLLPAFSFCPNLNNLFIVKDRHQVESFLSHATANQFAIEPNLSAYFDELDNQSSYRGFFSEMNQFYADNGYLPLFEKSASYSVLADSLQFGFNEDTFFVTLHMRRRSSDQASVSRGSNVARDANPDIWLSFIRNVASSHSNVKFIILGRSDEVSRELYKMPNVLFLKQYGMGLAEELTAIWESDLFMAISSGPAVAAIFSKTPYLIYLEEVNQKNAAEHKEVIIGEQLPFADEHQIHRWTNVTAELLYDDFCDMYQRLN
jgi:hypothetical protein